MAEPRPDDRSEDRSDDRSDATGLDPDGEPLTRPVSQDGTELSEYAHPEVEIPQVVRRPSTVGGFVYLLMLLVVVAGVVVAAGGRWRAGLIQMACALLVGAVVRMVLPESQTGMLHVRRRLVDVVILLLLGGTLLAVALSKPR